MQRPVHVVVITILQCLGIGALVLASVAIMIGGGSLFAMMSGGQDRGMGSVIGGLGIALGIVLLICAGIWIVVVINFWKLKDWARIVVLVFAILGLVLGLLGFAANAAMGILNPISMGVGLFRLSVNAYVIWFLFSAEGKQAFQAG
jgi:Ca2+/Na+ antiporter